MATRSTLEIESEVQVFFERYAAAFNEALAGARPAESVAGLYAEWFIGSGPGEVRAAENGPEFHQVLRQGYEAYRAIGMQSMAVLGTAVTPIDEMHAMATVHWRADYIRQGDQEPIAIEFDVTYLVRRREDGWEVFAFVAGDEQGEHEKHGLTPKAQ